MKVRIKLAVCGEGQKEYTKKVEDRTSVKERTKLMIKDWCERKHGFELQWVYGRIERAVCEEGKEGSVPYEESEDRMSIDERINMKVADWCEGN